MDKELVSNRKAYFSYEVLETFEAGIALQGTEIKSLKEGGGSLLEAFCKVEGSEVFMYGCVISPYKFGNIHNHDEKRIKKLLLHKREIEALRKSTLEKGFTIIPLSIHLRKGLAKVKIGIGKGKKSHDKRDVIKERDVNREMRRAVKQ